MISTVCEMSTHCSDNGGGDNDDGRFWCYSVGLAQLKKHRYNEMSSAAISDVMLAVGNRHLSTSQV